MQIIPSQIFNNNSAAEAKVHRFLMNINISEHDVALHSLNIGKHLYKNWSEGDFIIISELGILLIEVKGGRVSCNNGVWEYRNRYNKIKKVRRAGAQAKSAYYSLKEKFLDKKYKWILRDVPCGFACVFTDIRRVVTTQVSELNEIPDNITAYEQFCRSPQTFQNWLKTVFSFYRGKVEQNNEKVRNLSKEEIEDIKQFLRPNFEKQPALGFQIREFDEVLNTLTEDQYRVIAGIENNDRVIIEGGAGTGKTFCAMASARNHAGRYQEVLFITRSPYLAQHLKSTDQIPEKLFIFSWDEFNSKKADRKFDVLIVDEGQDLCQFEVIQTLDNCLKGGIEEGVWRWFCDKDHQISPSFEFEKDAFEYLKTLGAFKYSLQSNVRNTPEIIGNIELFSRVDMEKNPKGFGGKFYFETANDLDMKLDLLDNYLRAWRKKDNVEYYDICILCASNENVANFTDALTAKNYRVETLSINTMKRERKSIMVSTVEDFKGLERSIICLVDIPKKKKVLF